MSASARYAQNSKATALDEDDWEPCTAEDERNTTEFEDEDEDHWEPYPLTMPRIEEDRRLATKNVSPDEIREAVASVTALYPQLEAVWLFGSYSRGEQRATSDVDFAVMTARELARDYNHSADLEEAFERRLGVPVDVVVLHADLTLPLIWEALSDSQLLFARDPEDAHAFASSLRALVRDEWPRLERRWAAARRWFQECEDA